MTQTKTFIVFDWNGTLLDDTTAVFDSTNAMLKDLDCAPIDRATFHKNYTIPVENIYDKLGHKPTPLPHSLNARNTFHDHYESRAKEAGLREGAREILQHSQEQGLTSLILSNHIEKPIRDQLRRLKIEQYFSEILAYASRELQFQDMTKGERLRRHLATNEIKPWRGVIVGDTTEEIQIGRELGFVSVAITGGCFSAETLEEGRPDYLVSSLTELRPILLEEGLLS